MKATANATYAINRLRAHKLLIVSFCAAVAMILGAMSAGMIVVVRDEPRIAAPQRGTTSTAMPATILHANNSATSSRQPESDGRGIVQSAATTVVALAATPRPSPSGGVPIIPDSSNPPVAVPDPNSPTGDAGIGTGGGLLSAILDIDIPLLGRLLR